MSNSYIDDLPSDLAERLNNDAIFALYGIKDKEKINAKLLLKMDSLLELPKEEVTESLVQIFNNIDTENEDEDDEDDDDDIYL